MFVVLYGQNREPKLFIELHLRHFFISSSLDTIKLKYALDFSKLDEGLLTVKHLKVEFIVACHFQLNYFNGMAATQKVKRKYVI